PARLLPFPDAFFDAIFHFGGFNNFSEPKKTLAEMTRIVRQGGRIVFGDEALPPWLERTEFGEIIVTNNPLFKHKVPLKHLPVNAREVTLRWVLGGGFYLVDFKGARSRHQEIFICHPRAGGVGQGELVILGGWEGVTPEARKMTIEAAKAKGVSGPEGLESGVAEPGKTEPPPSGQE